MKKIRKNSRVDFSYNWKTHFFRTKNFRKIQVRLYPDFMQKTRKVIPAVPEKNSRQTDGTYHFVGSIIDDSCFWTLPVLISDKDRTLTYIFIFKLLCGASEGFMKAFHKVLRCFHKTFWGNTKNCKNKDVN